MIRRFLAAVAVFAIAALPSFAGAHEDYNADGDNNSATRCDTWYRDDHQTGPVQNQHSEDHSDPEFDQGEVGPLYIHSHTGHYVVRHDAFYVEIVGGGGYSRDGNNGGYVQTEVDAAEGAPDVDGHFDLFAGGNGGMHAENVCLSVADNKVGDEGEQP